MAWLWLLAAGAMEITWAVGLKLSDGFRKPWIAAATVVAMVASFVLLARALREIPLGTGYAVWTGIGAAGTAVLGILWFHEPRNWPRLLCLALIVAGIIGLKLTARTPTP